ADDSRIVAKGRQISFSLDRATANVESLQIAGREMFAGGFGFRPIFVRAFTDNDHGCKDDVTLAGWIDPVAEVSTDAQLLEGNTQAEITASYTLKMGATLTLTYTIGADGSCHVGYAYQGCEGAPDIPRLGIRFRTPLNYGDRFTWYGRGPQENYCDRSKGTFIGLYTASALDKIYPYVRPQETGHHTDTRWLEIAGRRIDADNLMEFNALRCSFEDLNLGQQKHISDIVTRDYVEVTLDLRQMGLGGFNSWGAHPSEQYLIHSNQDYNWGFTIR
ncbi:MAG: beta-galactosidase, partial [Bacteroidales bacterium]|nr:beta-galactosidase [Bacteroidales bacterium]